MLFFLQHIIWLQCTSSGFYLGRRYGFEMLSSRRAGKTVEICTAAPQSIYLRWIKLARSAIVLLLSGYIITVDERGDRRPKHYTTKTIVYKENALYRTSRPKHSKMSHSPDTLHFKHANLISGQFSVADISVWNSNPLRAAETWNPPFFGGRFIMRFTRVSLTKTIKTIAY